MEILLHPFVVVCLSALVGILTWFLKELYTKHTKLEERHNILSLHVATNSVNKAELKDMFKEQKEDTQRGFDFISRKLDADRLEFLSALARKIDKP